MAAAAEGSWTGSRRSSGVTVDMKNLGPGLIRVIWLQVNRLGPLKSKKWCKKALNLYYHRKGPQIRRRGEILERAGVIA